MPTGVATPEVKKEQFMPGEKVRWTKEAIEGTRKSGDYMDQALVIEGAVYEVVSVDEKNVKIKREGDKDNSVFPANINSIEKA